MKFLESITDRLTGSRDGYECGGCGIGFDKRRINCPACGSTNIQRARE